MTLRLRKYPNPRVARPAFLQLHFTAPVDCNVFQHTLRVFGGDWKVDCGESDPHEQCPKFHENGVRVMLLKAGVWNRSAPDKVANLWAMVFPIDNMRDIAEILSAFGPSTWDQSFVTLCLKFADGDEPVAPCIRIALSANDNFDINDASHFCNQAGRIYKPGHYEKTPEHADAHLTLRWLNLRD